jgi:hypothetical protein
MGGWCDAASISADPTNPNPRFDFTSAQIINRKLTWEGKHSGYSTQEKETIKVPRSHAQPSFWTNEAQLFRELACRLLLLFTAIWFG